MSHPAVSYLEDARRARVGVPPVRHRAGQSLPGRRAGRPGQCGPGAYPGWDSGNKSARIFTLQNAAVAAGATVVIGPNNVPFSFCYSTVKAVTTGAAGFLITNLELNGERQWNAVTTVHSAMLSPDATCVCDLCGDCTTPGATLEVTVQNLDAANPQGIFLHFIG